jgi:hypothetical protein
VVARRPLLSAALALAVWGCGARDAEPFVASVPGDRAVVWAVGDADGPEGDRLARMIAAARPDRVLYLGDVYENGSAAEFARWGRSWGRFGRRMAPTPGNHEWPLAKVGYRPYWRRITGTSPPDAYAFTAGGWEILSLNSEGPHATGSKQERWLRERVGAGPGDCRIAFWHRPRFSAGRHGDHRGMQSLWRHLPGHARMLLSGHDHDLQRLRPRGGVTQFVSGASGVRRRPSHRRAAPGPDPGHSAILVRGARGAGAGLRDDPMRAGLDPALLPPVPYPRVTFRQHIASGAGLWHRATRG